MASNNSSNPYHVDNPYQNNNNSDDNLQKFEKLRAKSEAKKALDKILQIYQNAKNNGLKIEKNYENIGAVRRYYNKYYLSNYVATLFFLGLASFFVSFFTKLTIFAIFFGLSLNIFYSKKVYLKSLFYTHSIDSEVKNDIFNYIFGENNSKIFVILGSFLFSLTAITSYFSKKIFLGQYVDTNFYKFLVKNFPSFNINNELFSYSILLSFVILIIFKIIKK